MERDAAIGAEVAKAEAPSRLNEEALYLALESWFREDKRHCEEWHDNARRDFDFFAGIQLDPKTKEALESEGRPQITWNQSLPIIKAVAGIEVNTRAETIYLPRGTDESDVVANELLTQASQWMADGCDAEHHESAAFQDCLKCGMGWVEERLDYEEDPDGKYVEERFSPLEAYWDCSARAKNIADSRRRWRVRQMPISEARRRWGQDGKISDVDLNCSWVTGTTDRPIQPVEERRLKAESNSSQLDDNARVTIVQCQWWERETYYRVVNPDDGTLVDMDAEQLKVLRRRAAEIAAATGQEVPIDAEPMTRKVYKQAFIGGRILKVGACPRKDGFTLQCLTGEEHHTKGHWFGILALLRDPQMMLNKWLSQATHIINSTAKGGVVAEEDAFVDMREAQATWASPDAITFVKKGAISGNKIMAKPGVGLAAVYFQLMQLALDSMPRVTGINMELMGLRDAQQPGVLEAQRKQAAMTILATLFDSLRAFRTEIGRTRLCFIQNYLADGRLIRILEEDGNGQQIYRAIRLMKDRVVGDYDVIVSEAPTSPNQKEATWAALQSVLPAFRDLITPEVAVMLLEYVPGIPRKLVDAFRNLLSAPDPQAQQAAQLELQGRAVEIEKDAASADKDRAQAAKTRAETVLNMAQAAGAAMAAQAVPPPLPGQGVLPRQLAPPPEDLAIAPQGGRPLPELGGPQVLGEQVPPGGTMNEG